MSIKTALKNIKDARKAYEKTMKDVGAKGIAEELGALVPPGYAFAWTQYTPYFNDGEACTFRVNEDATLVKLNEDGEYEGGRHLEEEGLSPEQAEERWGTEDEEKTYKRKERVGWGYPAEYKEVEYKEVELGFPAIEGYKKSNLGKLAKAWEEICGEDELLLEAFGDHARILIKSDGSFEIDEYSHD